jgi:hypothetical protein
MTAKAASNTPPNIKIKVVTICSSISNLLTKDEARRLAVNFAKQAERLRRTP